MRLTLRKTLTLGLLLALVGFVGIKALNLARFAYAPLGTGNAHETIIEIRKGEGPREISRALRAGAIFQSESDEQDFYWIGRILRQWGKIKAGEYEITTAMTPVQILSILTSGVSMMHPVTIREGENMYEIAAELEAKRLTTKTRFLGLCRNKEFMRATGIDPNAPSLEGFLFPNTYYFNRTQTAEDMARQMIHQFNTVWGPDQEQRAKQLGFSRLQVVTLASIVEKETGAPAERPMISSVFFNRLKKKMPLQSDPTTIYAIWERYKGNLHKRDLSEPSPYNTYYVAALPIGPIANPGKEAIQAALYPATSDFLFFVSHNDGTHQFSRTLREHESAVAKFQLDPKAREGKSWRNLSKTLAKPGQH